VLVQLIDGQPQIVNADETMVDWKVRLVESGEETPNVPRAELYRTRYAGVLQGDLGKSFRHGEPVLDVMLERLPVSTFYGLLTFFFTFLVCVPLGIAKAMKHNTWFDNGSSVFIFMGYAVPGYVLGALMMVFLAARWEWFPTGGFTGPNYESTPIENVSVMAGTSEWTAERHGLRDGQEVWLEGTVPAAEPVLEKEAAYVVAVKDADTFELLPESGGKPVTLQANAAKVELHRHTSPSGRALDLAWHAVLPLLCYLVGSFAFVTMLMKNHLMDNLSSDYMRTAIAKGVPFSQAVRRHALRNSLIPLATNIGHQITLFVAGSFLIETIFDINGFGLLGFKSVLDRDIPVVMGIFLLSATLMLLGNIISDILVALVDPRVRFN
jgi:ABC-type dipeptide/oligopeptide/nickel transport system permease component